MMPGGAQSSLVSTAIPRVGSAEVGEGSAGTANLKGHAPSGGIESADGGGGSGFGMAGQGTEIYDR